MTRTDLEVRLIAPVSPERAAEIQDWLARENERERAERGQLRAVSYAKRALIMERDGFRCRRCGAGPRDERLVIDHIVPLALGDDDNLQTLCPPCNQGKGARPPHPHDLEPR